MKYILHFLLFLISTPFFAQNKAPTLIGKVSDNVTNQPLPYATIQVFSVLDSHLISGGITDETGKFEIETTVGLQYLVVDFIGYKQLTSPAIEVKTGQQKVEMGNLFLELNTSTLDEVVVQAERSTMEFALDKRIFNVGKDLGNAGGSADEILNNIPSVLVDGEGNVKLRGSGNVRLLIDGKPSGLVSFKGGSGLQQLPASLIDKVEVITNPSARYEAEGMAGIINIVLKKERKKGFNGSFETTTGYPLNLGLAANLNYRHNKVNFFFNYGINYRKVPRNRSIFQEVFSNDTTFISEQGYDTEHIGFFNNIRGGIDYFVNEQNILTASYRYNRSKGNRLSTTFYKDYLKRAPGSQNFTLRTQDEQEVEPIAEYVLSYKKLFDKKDRELIAEIRYFDHWEDSDQVYTEKASLPNGNSLYDITQTAPNDETEKQLIGQLDYVHPLGKEGKAEIGFRASFRDMTNDYVVNNVDKNGVEIPIPSLDNKFVYKENINAVYGILGNKTKQFSYQFGLRTEWTDIETILEETAQSNPRKYVNFFPSIHFTYDLPHNHALQLSYSRRVRRPVYNELSSYVTYSDRRNFSSGNPDLNPEFSDVFELAHIKYFEKGSFSSAIYYRHTNDKIERIRAVDKTGFSKTAPVNLIDENAYGLEFISTFKATKWWKLDVNLNFYKANTDGSNIDQNFVSETFSWFARQTSRFTLAKDTYLQVRGNYQAAENIAQGRSKAIYFLDLAFNQPIFKDKGTLTFNIMDVFNSRKSRVITMGDNFRTEHVNQRIMRQINLTLGYKINQGK